MYPVSNLYGIDMGPGWIYDDGRGVMEVMEFMVLTRTQKCDILLFEMGNHSSLRCVRCGAPYRWDRNPSLAVMPPACLVKTCSCVGEPCEGERHYRVEWWDSSHFDHLRSDPRGIGS